MFVYEEIGEKWLEKIKFYDFKKPLPDGQEPETRWCVDHEKKQALYYIGWVSSAILRTEGESLYEFAFFMLYEQEVCVRVTVYEYPYAVRHTGDAWNDRIKVELIYYDHTGLLVREELEKEAREALYFYFHDRPRKRQS